MRKPGPDATAPTIPISPLPGWIAPRPADTGADAAFRSGAALAHLHLVTSAPDLPQALWRDRLALAAAVVCAGFSGRREGQAALRDAVAPAALAAFMSDRAARRLCDRLVDLGAVRELTGRDTFRLYGV